MRIDALIIIILSLIPVVIQLWALNLYMDRMGRALRRADDRPPFTTAVQILDLGPEPRAVARLLDRATRLDLHEVDQVIDRRGGRLPLPMSRPAALRLVRDLQQLGATAQAEYVGPDRSERA